MAIVDKRIFNSVVGHKMTIKRLLTMVSLGRVPNCLLFTGASAQGKMRVALGLVQAMLCEKSPDACGVCSICIRVYNQQCEGLILLEPEKGQIKIDAARDVVQQLSLSSWGKARVVIVDEAHQLNPQAANALLKSIEEPPAHTHFILISSSQENILKTLKSRSQIVRFIPLNRVELESLGRTDTDPELLHSADRIWSDLLGGYESRAIELTRETIENREKGQHATARFLESVRNLWVTGQTGLSLRQLSQMSLQILAAERDLKSNCDVQLTLENFLRESSRIVAQDKIRMSL